MVIHIHMPYLQEQCTPVRFVVEFLSIKLTFLSLKLTFLSLKLTYLSLKLTFLSLKLTFLEIPVRYAVDPWIATVTQG
jgi:hypothetical protein